MNNLEETATGTLLLRAATTGDIDALRAALDGGVDPDSKNDFGETALHITAGHPNARSLGMIRSVEWLLQRGASVNARGPKGVTPLLRAVDFATMTGYLDIVRTLIEAGADPDLATDSGLTARELLQARNTSHVRAILALFPT